MLGLLVVSVTQPAGAVSAPLDGELKEPVRGLLDRQGPAPAAYQSVVNAFVIRVPWATLQPAREPGTNHGGALDPAAITAALALPRAAGKPVRLRVTAGTEAPEWAKRLGGHKPMDWYADGALLGTIGRFWTPEFDTAYRNLQERLAALYDSDPRIREVVVARCTTEFAEPYTRQTNQLALNRPALEEAEYTSAADDRCHQEEIQAHQVWQRTRSYLALNPYQRINESTWTGTVDLPFTKDMIGYCRQILGARCVLGNNSLDPDRPAVYQQMYEHIAAQGGPIAYQTATAAKVCESQNPQTPCPPARWNAVLDMALDYGAGAVELPAAANGYTSWSIEEILPYHGLRYYDEALEAAPSLPR
jgi:hypothetical protein